MRKRLRPQIGFTKYTWPLEIGYLCENSGSSVEEIRNLVIDRLRNMEGVARTTTTVCFVTVEEES